MCSVYLCAVMCVRTLHAVSISFMRFYDFIFSDRLYLSLARFMRLRTRSDLILCRIYAKYSTSFEEHKKKICDKIEFFLIFLWMERKKMLWNNISNAHSSLVSLHFYAAHFFITSKFLSVHRKQLKLTETKIYVQFGLWNVWKNWVKHHVAMIKTKMYSVSVGTMEARIYSSYIHSILYDIFGV